VDAGKDYCFKSYIPVCVSRRAIAVFRHTVTQVLLGFLLMHFVAGLILTVVFQLAHTVEGTAHPMPDDNGIIENDWAIHQLNTTVNFSRKTNGFRGMWAA
jgi:hypothetical protein